MDIEEALSDYEARLEGCDGQVAPIQDIRARIGLLTQCREHYASLIMMARTALAVEALAQVFHPVPDDEAMDDDDMEGWPELAMQIEADQAA